MTLGRMRPWESWNRRAWIEADRAFEQSQGPAVSQVPLRKVEFGQPTGRGRRAVRAFTWAWMGQKSSLPSCLRDPLDEHAVEQMAQEVSTRHYARSWRRWPRNIRARALTGEL
jgi:hypothetical protein